MITVQILNLIFIIVTVKVIICQFTLNFAYMDKFRGENISLIHGCTQRKNAFDEKLSVFFYVFANTCSIK